MIKQGGDTLKNKKPEVKMEDLEIDYLIIETKIKLRPKKTTHPTKNK